jgi:hypothetical protein
MIDPDRQAAIVTLYRQGMHKKKIAARADIVDVSDTLLETLYRECEGYVQRIHERLTLEHGIAIGYSTLTRLVKKKGLVKDSKDRADHVPDIPGEEMQHDTSVYRIKIGLKKQKMVCSGLYVRYSKMRYIRFYPRFTRFTMKCFFDEALRFFGYCARYCIIDNTNLAILYGSGSEAVIHPEMVSFAKNYGFIWKAHAIGHANRKAGKERNFRTVETNFIPGRTFSSIGDLNQQAFLWATQHYATRPQSKTKLIPVELFETEKNSLIKLPPYITAPYLPFIRHIDEYGYIAFAVNYYWVPSKVTAKKVTVLLYTDHLRIMEGSRELIRYALPKEGVRNERFVPEGMETHPKGMPNNRKVGCEHEELSLRELGTPVTDYLDLIKAPHSTVKQRPAFIRGLYMLSKRLGTTIFITTLKRALCFGVTDLSAVSRIAVQTIKNTPYDQNILMESSSEYQKRPSYLEGRFTQENTPDIEQHP